MTEEKAGTIIPFPEPVCDSSGSLPGGALAWVVEPTLARCPACYATLRLVEGRLPEHAPSVVPGDAWREGIQLRVEGWRGENASGAEWVKEGQRWLLTSTTGEGHVGWIEPAKYSRRGWTVRVKEVEFKSMPDDHPTYLGGARSKSEAVAIIRHARRIRGLST